MTATLSRSASIPACLISWASFASLTLPRADEGDLYRRVAWCSVDKNAAVWVTGIPTLHMRAGR